MKIMEEIDRWRVCQGRHIRELAGFSGQRACDRRLRKLIEAGYIKRERILYGVAGIYSNTIKTLGKMGVSFRNRKIRVEQITHDIAVVDTAIYFNKRHGIEFSNMQTEIELHRLDGFGIRKHRPDFVFTKDGKLICVEVELSLKAKHRFINIMRDNFSNYEKQIWVVPSLNSKIAQTLVNNKLAYSNIELLELGEIQKYE
ncbi:MAG: hypothetical protein FWD82_03495 [Defluviitaleaceae bacterium]|nr:hypothetical protein [Defluviitaleaceae bacterium]